MGKNVWYVLALVPFLYLAQSPACSCSSRSVSVCFHQTPLFGLHVLPQFKGLCQPPSAPATQKIIIVFSDVEPRSSFVFWLKIKRAALCSAFISGVTPDSAAAVRNSIKSVTAALGPKTFAPIWSHAADPANMTSSRAQNRALLIKIHFPFWHHLV